MFFNILYDLFYYKKVEVSPIYDSVHWGVPVREDICPEPPA